MLPLITHLTSLFKKYVNGIQRDGAQQKPYPDGKYYNDFWKYRYDTGRTMNTLNLSRIVVFLKTMLISMVFFAHNGFFTKWRFNIPEHWFHLTKKYFHDYSRVILRNYITFQSEEAFGQFYPECWTFYHLKMSRIWIRLKYKKASNVQLVSIFSICETFISFY